MRVFLALFIVIFLPACTSLGILDKNANFPTKNESIFILGISPSLYRISVFPGELVENKFKQNSFSPAAVHGIPENGFLIGKAAEGEVLAIMNIGALNTKDDVLFVPQFRPCEGARAMTFTVPGGKVIYVGNVEYQRDGSRLRPIYSQDLESATKYIDANYPNLRGKVELWKYELIPALGSCTQTVHVPIYLPSR